jgi:hypothetical protein
MQNNYSRHESGPPIPPRSQQRAGPGLRPSQDGIVQMSSSLLSPPDQRGLGYQNNGSSESLSKNYRSTTIITPRNANYPSTPGLSSIASPATAKMPTKSYLMAAGNILDQFTGSDYANVGPANDISNVPRRSSRSNKRPGWVQISNGCLALLHECVTLLRFYRPALVGRGNTGLVNDIDVTITGIETSAEQLRTRILSMEPTPQSRAASQQRNIERILYTLLRLAIDAMYLFMSIAKDHGDVFGSEVIRKMWYFHQHVAMELYFVNNNLVANYNELRQNVSKNSRAATSTSSRDQSTTRGRAGVSDTSKASTENSNAVARAMSAASKQSTLTGGYMISPPVSPPMVVNSTKVSVDGHYLTSPTLVPDMFKTGDWLNAGPNGKLEYDFMTIVKALDNMLQVCIKPKAGEERCNLEILQLWYRQMMDPRQQPTLLPIHKSFQRLVEGTDTCIEKLRLLAAMLIKFTNRTMLREHNEFWQVTREAILVSSPNFHSTHCLPLQELDEEVYYGLQQHYAGVTYQAALSAKPRACRGYQLCIPWLKHKNALVHS